LINEQAVGKIINSTEHRAGKVVAFTLQILIVISLITFSIDTLPDLADNTQNILHYIEPGKTS